jgi:hypothetical protein
LGTVTKVDLKAVYYLAGPILLGSLTLWRYVTFRRGADRPSARRLAQLCIEWDVRNLPAGLLAGAVFWYSCVLAALTAFLPEGPLQSAAIPVGLLLVLIAVVLVIVWAYRPPRWVLPAWYRAELAQVPKAAGRRRSRALGVAMMWIGGLLLGGAYLAYRLHWDWPVIVAAAIVGAAFMTGYVMSG